VDDDRLFFDWARYYAGAVVLMTLLGLAIGAAYRAVTRPPAEAWSVVVQTEDRISTLQLGFVAQSVFRSESVYGPVIRNLGIDSPPERFLEEQAELRPVAETDALIVIGRGRSQPDAIRLSVGLTRALIRAFEEQGLSTLQTFGRAVPVREDVSGTVAVAIGGSAGFWLGLGIAVLHYRLRRPVLALQRAAALTEPRRVTVVDGPWPRWLGALRPLGRAEESARDRNGPANANQNPDKERGRSKRMRNDGPGRLVASPRTSERIVGDLIAANTGNILRELVWIR
jgi:hypothetical protein